MSAAVFNLGCEGTAAVVERTVLAFWVCDPAPPHPAQKAARATQQRSTAVIAKRSGPSSRPREHLELRPEGAELAAPHVRAPAPRDAVVRIQALVVAEGAAELAMRRGARALPERAQVEVTGARRRGEQL